MIVRDGRRTLHDYGPLAARVSGVGGTPVGHGIPIVSYATPKRTKPACEKPIRGLGPCARMPGHLDRCEPVAMLQRRAHRRRL